MAANSGGSLNGFTGDVAVPASTATCAILNDSGTAVTTVTIDTQHGSDQVFWLRYEPASSAATKVTFTVTSASSSDPLATVTQKFRSGGGIDTPFGIPYWGGNLTTGSYKLVASDNAGGHATCTFSAS
ncbi:MAG TPA: hypothetical protein DCX12_12800 [Chloroflexi bacterium]|nr:hypothetical protein [Chloroflexota bacterium]HBV93241.1 hypothetical protein [Chloroflexota bacterium]